MTLLGVIIHLRVCSRDITISHIQKSYEPRDQKGLLEYTMGYWNYTADEQSMFLLF